MSDTEVPTSGHFEAPSLVSDRGEHSGNGPDDEPSVTLEITREFAAIPGAIYHAWLDPDLLADWVAPTGYTLIFDTVSIEPDIGGWQRFRLEHADDPTKTQVVTARLTELVEPGRVVAEHHVDDEHTTTIEVDIEGSPEGCRMRLRQYPHPESTLDRGIAAWQARFDQLEQAIASRT